MANSRQKGSKNERELCKWFTDWTKGLEFQRVPASGGLRWKKTDDITGDIICSERGSNRKFPFTVEAKFYKDINFEHLILGNKKIKILEFWEQAKEDSIRAQRRKAPMLFMRYNGMPKRVWFVVMEPKTFDEIDHTKGKHTHFKIQLETGEELYIMNSNDLLNTDYKTFAKYIKSKLRNG